MQGNVVLLYPQGLILLLITNSVQISNSQGQTQHYRCSERMVFGHVKRSGEVPHPVHSQMAQRTRHLPRDLLPVQISGLCWAANPTSRKYVPPCLISMGWGSLTAHSLAIFRNARWALCMRRGPWACKWNFTFPSWISGEKNSFIYIYTYSDPKVDRIFLEGAEFMLELCWMLAKEKKVVGILVVPPGTSKAGSWNMVLEG